MRQDTLINEYFEWMYQIVCKDRYTRRRSYRKLLIRLFDTEFIYIISMDSNRAEDGINLRYRFGREFGYRDPEIAACLDNRSCSVLEMMVALAIRCEEHILGDADIGDRTGEWFWIMIDSLGLRDMNDGRFDGRYVDETIDIFLNREYGRDGEGGLFFIKDCPRDLRHMEIYYQMCWYINKYLNM